MKTDKVMAAFHLHSDWSYDGKWPLEKLVSEFGRRSYRVLMMTEHDRGFSESRLLRYREACVQASTENVLVIPGIEYSDAANVVHVLVWGTVPFLGESQPTGMVLESVKSFTGVAVLAHPERNHTLEWFDPNWMERIIGIELWNRKMDGWAPSPKAMKLLRMAKTIPFVGMDFHNRRQLFPVSMALDIQAPITEEKVMDCLRTRKCYACVCGTPLSEVLSESSLSVMRAVEKGRRVFARIYRYFKNKREKIGHEIVS